MYYLGNIWAGSVKKKTFTILLLKTALLLISVFICQSTYSQVDTLNYKRNTFNTAVFLNHEKLAGKELSNLYKLDKTASRKYNIGRIMLPAAPVFAISGTALAVDALIGINRTAIIDGTEYAYKERSLPKLLIGLALFVTGGSFMEGANDFKRTAAQRYNEALRKTTETAKTTYHSTWGITEAGNIGFRLEF